MPQTSPDLIPGDAARPAPQQLRLCIAQEISPDSPALNHGLLLRAGPSIDTSLFRTAVGAVISRHDALRGRFHREGPDGWAVRFGLPARPESNVTVLGEDDLLDRAQHEIDRPFDLSREPPLRVNWWHIGAEIACQLTFHHIATDARTVDLLLDEIQQQYCDQPASADGVGYYSLAAQAWARHATTGYHERLQEYAERVEKTGVDSIFPAIPGQKRETSLLSWQVPGQMAEAVSAHADALGCTRFAVWLTAWVRALAMALGRKVVPVAVPVSSRVSRTELSAVGFFVNSVVIPLRHEQGEPFASACRRTSSEIMDALDRRDIPLHELVHRLPLSERGLDNPLTAVSAQLLPAERRLIHLPDGPVTISYLESTTPRYRISLDIREQDDGPIARIRADTSVIEPARLQALRQLMERDITGPAAGAPRNPGAGVRAGSSSSGALVAPIRRWVRARPHEVAVQWAGGGWTWAELGDALDQTASALQAHGVQAGDTAVIELPRGPHFIATLIALLELDAIPVMARAGWPEETLTQLAVNVGATVRVTASQHVRATPVSRAELTRFRDASVPSGTAYVTFTSGSTGQPKGVPAPVQGAFSYLNWVGAATAISHRDRCLQVAAIGFDALIRDTLAPLNMGATLVLLPDELRLSGEGIARVIRDEEISAVLSLIPAQLRLMTSHLKTRVPRVICVAGEPLFQADAEYLSRVAPQCRLLNLYGPTEATMTSTCLVVDLAKGGSGRLPVGHPVPHAGVHVLGPGGGELPPGCSGEIVISGPGVATRYITSPGAAAGRFGFRLLEGQQRWSYATGDTGYWLNDDGGLRLEGRLDAEHKVNGERVDLAAVESALAAHPAVMDTALSVERHGHLNIVSAHVLLRDQAVTGEDLRVFLAGKVSNAAMPRRFASVDHIPRLANGKLDRAGLPSQASSPAVPPTGRRPSWRQVQQAVADVLGQVPDDPQATLFTLGADSLAVIEILERLDILRTAPGQAIRVFNDPHLATLVGFLDRADPTAAVQQSQSEDLDSVVPVSDADSQPGTPTIICFPPAGGDLVSFSPAADALGPGAKVVVARRPDVGLRSVSTAVWVDAHVLGVARYASLLPTPVLLCGYSVGFLLACLTADALALNHDRDVHAVIGINPSTPGVVNPAAKERGTTAGSHESARTRLSADLAIRSVKHRADGGLPPLLLLQGDEDQRSWDRFAGDSTGRFTEIIRRKIPGGHTLTVAEMYTVGRMVSQWVAGLERLRCGG